MNYSSEELEHRVLLYLNVQHYCVELKHNINRLTSLKNLQLQSWGRRKGCLLVNLIEAKKVLRNQRLPVRAENGFRGSQNNWGTSMCSV